MYYKTETNIVALCNNIKHFATFLIKMQQENNTKLIISRLRKAFNLESNQELAELLGVNESTIRSWISRDSADLKLIVAICSEKDIHFILTGKSAPNFAPNIAPNIAPNSKEIAPNSGNESESVGSTCLNCKIIEARYFEAQAYLRGKEQEVKELVAENAVLKHENTRLEGENERLREDIAHYEFAQPKNGTHN